jgi:hypothetical protein
MADERDILNALKSHKQAIDGLSAETFAHETLLFALFARMLKSNPASRPELADVFDAAASFIEERAISLGVKASPNHLVKALKIVEDLRTQLLGKPDKPKDGI